MASKIIPVASDHAGCDLKEKVIELIEAKGYKAEDLGTNGPDSVDYPDYGAMVAQRVSQKEAERGILICGTGIGMSITANKFPGVRAALVFDEFTARMSREHNDANIMVVGARTLPHEKTLKMVEVWLDTPFAGDRHQRRLDIITGWEKKIAAND